MIQYRKRWLDTWEKNPEGCRFDLVKADHPAYTWLRSHDNEWMINNSPQTIKPKGVIINKNWDELDCALVGMVNEAVNYIKNLEGKPERITKANIGSYMRQKDTIIKWAKNELKKAGIREKSGTISVIYLLPDVHRIISILSITKRFD